MQRRASNISNHYVITPRISEGIYNARNEYGDRARSLKYDRLTEKERLRLVTVKDLNVSDISLEVTMSMRAGK